ncbi:hypothetical protein PC9H_007871 [Pleurotus ostreatus]|nr:uncharacterized protein PC9H_007871 [Pleurotus ostreatus]KAF7428644.1 hypothetical protein PC9H_007871 [Pleurotus ostreatus]
MKFGDSTKIDYIPCDNLENVRVYARSNFARPYMFIQLSSTLGSYSKAYRSSFANFGYAAHCVALCSPIEYVPQWSFTLGLALSCALDIIITASLCYFLLRNRKQTSSMNHVIDSLMLYAFENGSLTCAATVMSMICWLTMPSNLVFMGIHFFISKLYANSLLAT